jgi:hypothetical protein
MKTKLITGLLATITALAAGMAHTAEVLPPPYLRVLITAEYVPTRLEVGQVYAVHISRQRDASYAATVVDQKGNQLYNDLPVRIECKDPSKSWPERAIGVVRPTPVRNDENRADEPVADVDIADPKDETCHVHLMAPVDPWMPSGDK